jgi:hypothetical protein
MSSLSCTVHSIVYKSSHSNLRFFLAFFWVFLNGILLNLFLFCFYKKKHRCYLESFSDSRWSRCISGFNCIPQKGSGSVLCLQTGKLKMSFKTFFASTKHVRKFNYQDQCKKCKFCLSHGYWWIRIRSALPMQISIQETQLNADPCG